MTRRGISSSALSAVREVKESLDQEVALDLIRHSLDMDQTKDAKSEEMNGIDTDMANLLTKGYWTHRRATEAEEYIKDVVYGGVEGFAYVRSLAEFVDYSPPEVYVSSFGQSHTNSPIKTGSYEWNSSSGITSPGMGNRKYR